MNKALQKVYLVRHGSNAGKTPLGALMDDSERFDWQDDYRRPGAMDYMACGIASALWCPWKSTTVFGSGELISSKRRATEINL